MNILPARERGVRDAVGLAGAAGQHPLHLRRCGADVAFPRMGLWSEAQTPQF